MFLADCAAGLVFECFRSCVCFVGCRFELILVGWACDFGFWSILVGDFRVDTLGLDCFVCMDFEFGVLFFILWFVCSLCVLRLLVYSVVCL